MTDIFINECIFPERMTRKATIKYRCGKKNITYELTDLQARRVLKYIAVIQDENLPMLWWYEKFCSPELYNADKFRKILPKFDRNLPVKHESILPIKLIIDEKSEQREIDWNEWKKDVKRMFSHHDPQKIEHALIHISGNIPEDVCVKMSEIVWQNLLDRELHIIFTDRKTDYVFVELLLYGDLFEEPQKQ